MKKKIKESDKLRSGGKTREQWLRNVLEGMRPMFKRAGKEIPTNVRLTMSLTKGRKVIGCCFYPPSSKDKHFEILIRLDHAEPLEVAAVLAHELVHAAVYPKTGHGAPFKAVALAIGLEGKMTSTRAGEAFRAEIAAVLKAAGPFPHAPLNFDGKQSGPKKQGTRLLKCECQECGYICRVTSVWLEEPGPPICPCNGEPMSVEANAMAVGRGVE